MNRLISFIRGIESLLPDWRMNHSLRFALNGRAGRFRGSAFVTIIFFALALAAVEAASAQNGPPLFSHEELVRLYEEETLSEPLVAKLRTLLTTPFVDNSATARGVRPLKPASPRLGRFLRVAQWNIERGIEVEAVAAALARSEERRVGEEEGRGGTRRDAS